MHTYQRKQLVLIMHTYKRMSMHSQLAAHFKSTRKSILKLVCTAVAMAMYNNSLTSTNYENNMQQLHQRDIVTEYRLINEVKYKLSHLLYISTGLSAARLFTPVVKIANSKKCVTFVEDEWQEFLKYEDQISEHVSKRKRKREDTDAHIIVLTKDLNLLLLYNNRPIVKIVWFGESEIVLDRTCIHSLVNLTALLNNRLNRLELLDFKHYYGSLIKSICCLRNRDGQQQQDDTTKTWVRKIICGSEEEEGESQTRTWSSEYTDCVLEILSFELEKLESDVGCLTILLFANSGEQKSSYTERNLQLYKLSQHKKEEEEGELPELQDGGN